jgi:hypothetical protein
MLLGTRRRVAAAVSTVAAAIALALVMSGRGCAAADATPDGAVRAFVAAARSGDREATWALLGPRTRERIERHAVDASEKVGGAKRFHPLDMFDVSAGQGSGSLRVRVAERSGDDAVVEVTSNGKTDRVTLVRIDGKWRIELP